MKLQHFILSNKNTNIKWKIDGVLYTNISDIPIKILEKHVYEWLINQWEGYIQIITLKYLYGK